MYKKKFSSLAILIPSFNELHNLKKFIIKLNKNYRVLIIDDCSQDQTSEWLKKNGINFIKNKFNMGYEKSLIKGFKYLIKKKNIEKIITMDADGQHNFKYIKNFLTSEKKYDSDLIVGARHKKNRYLEKIISNIFFKKFLLHDPLSGFKLYNSKKLKKIDLDNVKNLFLVDLLVSFIKQGYKVKCIFIKTKNRPDDPRVGGIVSVSFKMLLIFKYVLFNT
tara:strand:+ start:375 stop:1034 length:660 start_codon:yes stop_codon:yes gene_type:complete